MKRVGASPATFIAFGLSDDDSSKNVGFIRSTDGGVTWQQFAPELRELHISVFTVSPDGNTIYANEGGTYGGWISRNAGASWTMGPTIQVNGPVAISPANSSLVLFGSTSRGILRSANGLQSAQSVLSEPVPAGYSDTTQFRDIVFAPSNPNIVYAEADGYLLYRSDDAGVTWRFLVNGRDDVLNAQP